MIDDVAQFTEAPVSRAEWALVPLGVTEEVLVKHSVDTRGAQDSQEAVTPHGVDGGGDRRGGQGSGLTPCGDVAKWE